MRRFTRGTLAVMLCVGTYPSFGWGQDGPQGDRDSPSQHTSSSSEPEPFYYPKAPKANDEDFVVDTAPGMLATQCRYREDGDICVALPIGRVVGDVAALKANGMIDSTVTLEMP